MASDKQIEEDLKWMQLAVSEAKKAEGDTAPNPPVGAVIVKQSKLVSTGYHKKAGLPHAEREAIAAAGSKDSLKGATIYVTLEPCSTTGRTGPCTEAIIAAGISRVVFAVMDPNPQHAGRAIKVLNNAGIKVDYGIMEKEATALIAPFTKLITRNLPYVTLKMAMTLDGRIADSNYCSKWISGKEAGFLVQHLRHQCDAIMVGSNTIIKDNSKLICHDQPQKYRRRIIIASSKTQLPLSSNIFTIFPERTIIALPSDAKQPWVDEYKSTGAAVISLQTENGDISMPELMHKLANMGVAHILCEGGGFIAGQLIKHKLADNFLFFIAPKFLGDKGIPVLSGQNWSLAETPEIKIESTEMIGKDILIRAVNKL